MNQPRYIAVNITQVSAQRLTGQLIFTMRLLNSRTKTLEAFVEAVP